MEANSNNNTITINFVGNLKDFDGTECPCEWHIETNPQESVRELIAKFYEISGLKPNKYRLYFNNKTLSKECKDTVAQKGLTNNATIEISIVIEECFADLYIKNNLDFKIHIKFIKNSQYSAYNQNNDLKGILKLCLLNEIASKIDNTVLDNMKNNNNNKDIYFILKVLKDSGNNLEKKDTETIVKMMGKDKGKNIMNFSNFVDDKIDSNLLQSIINLLNRDYLPEINDTKLRLGKYAKYNDFFEKELHRYFRESVFEFSVVSLVVMDRPDYDKFENERRNCPNRVDRLLFHGTQIHPISGILTGLFRRSEKAHYQHGKGVYFTDSLDYCWFYGGDVNNRANKNIIPKIGDIFTAISNLVYYSKEGYLKVKDYKTRIQPKKNQINFAYAGCLFETVENPDFKHFVGTEYVIWDLDQICPFVSIRFRREEYCVIWRDDNFSEKAVYNNKFDEIFKKFLKERMKYIEQTSKFNIYPCKTTEEALNLVRRKKYNKIILLSNVGPDFGGKKFVDAARKIIGNDVMVLFLAYNIKHLDWIKNYKNAIFSNEPKFYEEYLDCIRDENKLKELIKQLEQHYKVKFNIDYKTFLKFPLYKSEGKYSDLSFE